MTRTKETSSEAAAAGTNRPVGHGLSAVVPEADEEPRPKLSPLRVLVALALLGGAGFGGYAAVAHKLAASAVGRTATFFAPYVDVTVTPTYQFQSQANDPARQTVLGFVVAASSHACAPSWGGYFSASKANQAIALGSRIAQLRSYGASVVASFGGAANTSLDVACTSPKALAAAYQSVIDTYDLNTIDLDVEGAALGNFAVEQRRAEAIRLLQAAAAARAHRTLHVWLTLPVEPSGLQDGAWSVVASMLRDRVRLAGVDVMAMDFSHAPTAGSTMLDEVERSLVATEGQLAHRLPQYGIHLRPAQIWHRIGVTVMIGQNNVAGERFTTAGARGLVSFARSKGLGRVSMWSVNRDQPCGASFGAVLSNTCSGTPQTSLEFSRIFGQLQGSIPASDSTGVSGVLRPVAPDTNPANAPFPLWSPSAAYVTGYKVVQGGEIYQAKWYSSGQDPAAQYQYSWQSPWELLGPVLPTDRAPVIVVPPGTHYPAWSASRLYVAGQHVLYKGLPYQAKWSSQGVAPGVDAGQQPSSPWRPLYRIPGEPVAGG